MSPHNKMCSGPEWKPPESSKFILILKDSISSKLNHKHFYNIRLICPFANWISVSPFNVGVYLCYVSIIITKRITLFVKVQVFGLTRMSLIPLHLNFPILWKRCNTAYTGTLYSTSCVWFLVSFYLTSGTFNTGQLVHIWFCAVRQLKATVSRFLNT